MKVLVTGGSGFIGSHLCKRLSRDHDVHVLDVRPPSSKDVTWHGGSILDRDLLNMAVSGCDRVFHLAARTSVPESFDRASDYYATNVDGTWAVLEAAKGAGVGSVTLASSAAVYGAETAFPLQEEITAPNSPYGTTKAINELQGRMAAQSGDLGVTSLRFFNVFGPGQSHEGPYASVIPRFIHAAKKGTPLQVFGDGSQTRDFVPVSLVVDALITAAARRGKGEVVNVCSGTETSVKKVAEIVTSIAGPKTSITHGHPREGDVPRNVGDSTRLQKVLKIQPTVDLVAEIAACCDAL